MTRSNNKQDPPVQDPPVQDPPVQDPPVQDPPVQDPPVQDPPDVRDTYEIDFELKQKDKPVSIQTITVRALMENEAFGLANEMFAQLRTDENQLTWTYTGHFKRIKSQK